MHRISRLLGALAALALLLTLAPAPATRAAGTASPAAGPAGTRFNFSFSGYEPGERVDAWVTTPAGRSLPRYPSIEADGSGRIVWSYDIPADAQAGAWTAAARGTRSGATDSAGFTVTSSAAAPAPAPSVEPASGGPGTSFRFRAAGFAPGERVGAWLAQPDGKSRELSDEVFDAYADEAGALAWAWDSPADAPAGRWTAVAQGISSRYVAQIGFTVTGGAPEPARSISPTSGGPGTVFSVVAGGFAPGERVGSWLNEPSGARRDSQSPWLIADAAGEVRWQWVAPSDAPAGRWQAVSQGTDSKAEVVLGFELSGTAPPPAPPAGVRGGVSPERGPPGTTFTFSVAGFEPGETIVYFVEDPAREPRWERTTVVADAAGAGSWSFTPAIDPATRTGAWQMSAYGERSRRELQIGFTVTEPEARPLEVSPGRGGPGTTFRFRAEGFARKEKIGVWFNGPDGNPIDLGRDIFASVAGVAEWEWTAPADALTGGYEVFAQGVDTEVLRRARFTVENGSSPGGPPASVSPERGRPGTTFTFTAGGFKKDERVGYWLNAPDGTIYQFDREAVADAGGLITVAIAFPADDSLPRGLWVFVARSSQSDDVINNVSHEIRFTLE